MAGWTSPYNLLCEEICTLTDQGACIPEHLTAAIAALHPVYDEWNVERIDPLYAAIQALPIDPRLSAAEPNELTAIRRLRPAGPRDLMWQPSLEVLQDRLHGAWTGRAVGCALGKPVEGIGMSSRDGAPYGRTWIKALLEKRGDWPLRDFFDGRDVGDGEHSSIICPASQRSAIQFMEPDDDIHYSLVGLAVIEQHGPGFTWEHVARFWAGHIPYSHICTAERQALLNFLNRSSVQRGNATAVHCRSHRNPYREWIGAQIRSDGWAWVCAGRPELAAEFAYRDAAWTHERNGIYGAMFFAAMQAAAVVEADAVSLVQIGLSEIPRACRLAIAVRKTLEIVASTNDFVAAAAAVDDVCATLSPTHMWGNHGGPLLPVRGMSPVHTINNACLCVVALVCGRMDTQDAITTAVMCGLDTDCNGASVGSIVGAAAGRGRFSTVLAPRLNDTIKPAMIDFQTVTMSELAQRTAVQWQRVNDWITAGRPESGK